MDTTNANPGDSLQPGAGQASTGGEGQAPPSTPKTYTEEELQKQVEKAKNDALAAAGRDAKKLSDKEATLNAEREAVEAEKVQIAKWQKQREEAELEEARRDPDKLAAWQKKQAEKTRDAEFTTREANLKKREAEQSRREAENAAAIQAAQETQLEIAIWEIGAAKGINPVTLKDSMKRLKLTTKEQAEDLAETMSQTPKRPAGSEGEAKPGEEFTPSSGVTSGWQGEPTLEQLEKMPMGQYAAWVQKRDAKK